MGYRIIAVVAPAAALVDGVDDQIRFRELVEGNDFAGRHEMLPRIENDLAGPMRLRSRETAPIRDVTETFSGMGHPWGALGPSEASV